MFNPYLSSISDRLWVVSGLFLKGTCFPLQTFSKEDVAALKSRLQKIQEQKRKPSPVPAASVDASDVKATLARARELVARVQQRKEKDTTGEAKAAPDETPPEPEDRYSATKLQMLPRCELVNNLL